MRLQAAVLMAPDMNKVDLAGQPVAPAAAARAFWSRSQGVVFAASKLPALPAGKTYQLWLVPASGAPLSAGLIAPDAQGNATIHFPTPQGTPDKVAALAVTLEPEGGVPAPTGDKYLVGLSSF
jgi:anti-sigma-K factor RskA